MHSGKRARRLNTETSRWSPGVGTCVACFVDVVYADIWTRRRHTWGCNREQLLLLCSWKATVQVKTICDCVRAFRRLPRDAVGEPQL